MAHEPASSFISRKMAEVDRGKTITIKDIGRKARHKLKIAARTMIPAKEIKQKVFVLERLEHLGTDGKMSYGSMPKIQYRIGYYMVGRNGNKRDKWTWGQYTPMISASDLKLLLKKAEEEGTLI